MLIVRCVTEKGQAWRGYWGEDMAVDVIGMAAGGG